MTLSTKRKTGRLKRRNYFLNHAAELATTINYAPFQKYAQTRIAEINSLPAPKNSVKEKFIQFIQQPWVS
ncbi:MAG: hypothetical protein KME52_22205 [Desmonostoc geniculatum HA4340-LM1]|nr:hypothetical protein [Desmonostoc geniculatum HA4340-LM1]